jgi:ABC-type nitrate/sulfonate/bicarbonate transport system ATPase subunit
MVRALLYRPSFLMLDELFTGLDNVNSQYLSEEIRNYITESNALCLFVTHNVGRALRLADAFYHVSPAGNVEHVMELDESTVMQRMTEDVRYAAAQFIA